MNLLDFKNKLIKGKELGGEVVYIREDNLLYGIESIYKNHEVNSISLLKSEQNSIKVHDLIDFLETECEAFCEGDFPGSGSGCPDGPDDRLHNRFHGRRHHQDRHHLCDERW